MSKITDLDWRDAAVWVNEAMRLVPVPAPAGFSAMRFDDGFMVSQLRRGASSGGARVHDPFGYATGALCFDCSTAAGQSSETVVSCVTAGGDALRHSMNPCSTGVRGSRSISGAATAGRPTAIRATLTATAHVLVTRDGPALQPGPRRYTRSWIRDGAMMSAALLRMGHAQEVREFIEWYAPHQRADGFVPCCVDSDGIDWLVEHDSHGQLLALIADHHRFTSDADFLRRNSGRSSIGRQGISSARSNPTGSCRFRSVTRAISRSRCIHIGTTSGLCAACCDAEYLAASLGRADSRSTGSAAHARRGGAVRLD
jgi:hypothetical protein